MEYTGERMVPEEAQPEVFWEHVYRYRFATRFVRGKRVLDIACGEGYGAAGLSTAGARSVVGVDLSEDACAHARKKYGIDARPGDAENIPLENASVDVVVSFETIEHVPNPRRFLDECLRVLAPGGIAIISTPNEPVYNERGKHNPFHCSELAEKEFTSFMSERFGKVSMYSQMPTSAAWWSARSLVAGRSPWRRVKGYWRVRNLITATQCPHLADEDKAAESYRQSVIPLMTMPDARFEFMVNPYLVRKRSPASGERPMYLIAVARR